MFTTTSSVPVQLNLNVYEPWNKMQSTPLSPARYHKLVHITQEDTLLRTLSFFDRYTYNFTRIVVLKSILSLYVICLEKIHLVGRLFRGLPLIIFQSSSKQYSQGIITVNYIGFLHIRHLKCGSANKIKEMMLLLHIYMFVTSKYFN